MELWATEGIITGVAWTMLCVASVAYLPIWHLLVGVLIAVNILLFVLIIYTFLNWTTFSYTQILFDITWSPLVNVFNYSRIQFTERNLQGRSKLLPFDKGIPPWGRRHIFVISIIALNCGTSAQIIIYISWIIFFNSLMLMVKEIFGSEESKNTKFNDNLVNEVTIASNFMSKSIEDVTYTTHLWFWTIHLSICILCIAFNCLTMTLINVGITVLFACSSHSQIQLQTMTYFSKACPYVLDGLGELAVLGFLLLTDIIINGSLFLLAFYSDSSLLFVCLTYCNAFAAVMEFHIRVWLPFRNETFLIKCMRKATQEELVMHNDVCAICLVFMTSARVTVCQHMFHGKCLRLSLKNSAQCPLCKSTLVTVFGHAHILS